MYNVPTVQKCWPPKLTSTNSLQSYYEKWHVLWYSTYYIGKYLQFKEFEHKVDEYFIYILYCQFCKDFCVSAMENVIQHFLDFNMNIIYITTIMCSVISEEIWNTLLEMHSLYFLMVLAKHNLSKKSSCKGNGRIIMQYGWLFFFSIPSMNWTEHNRINSCNSEYHILSNFLKITQ